MSSTDNVERARAAFDAFNRQDIDAVIQGMAPDAELDWSRAIGPYRGVYRPDDFGHFLADFSGTFESIRIEPEEFIDAGEHVVVPWTFLFKGRDGIEATASGAILLTYRGGVAIRACLYQEEREALEAAGLAERANAVENVNTVRRFLRSFDRRDLDDALRLLHDDASWHNTRVFPGPIAITGSGAIVEFLRTLAESFDPAETESEIEGIAVADDRVVAKLRSRGRGAGSGAPIDVGYALILRLRDQRIARVDVSGDYSSALEAAGLRNRAPAVPDSRS